MPKRQTESEQAEKQGRAAPPTAYPPGVSGNPKGRPPADRTPDPEGGVVTAGRMRKVLGQVKASDAGPTEKELRRWLDKDPKGYSEAIDKKARQEGDAADKDAEVARLRGRVQELEAVLQKRGADAPGEDPGTEAALGVIEKVLREAAGG